jgi:hypothetical protein
VPFIDCSLRHKKTGASGTVYSHDLDRNQWIIDIHDPSLPSETFDLIINPGASGIRTEHVFGGVYGTDGSGNGTVSFQFNLFGYIDVAWRDGPYNVTKVRVQLHSDATTYAEFTISADPLRPNLVMIGEGGQRLDLGGTAEVNEIIKLISGAYAEKVQFNGLIYVVGSTAYTYIDSLLLTTDADNGSHSVVAGDIFTETAGATDYFTTTGVKLIRARQEPSGYSSTPDHLAFEWAIDPVTGETDYRGIYVDYYVTIVEIDGVVAFSWLPAAPDVGELVTFTDESTYPDIAGWFWDFADGTYSTEQNPTHAFDPAAIYSVRLTLAIP